MEERIEEGIIKESIDSITIKQTEEILNQMKNSICKINGKTTGTGFFCYINYEGKEIPCLVTNYHVLDNNFIKEKKMIDISMNDNGIIEEISIKEKDIIYLSPNNEYDTIIIKLKKEKNNINYLKLDDKLFNKNSEKEYESIYILHYPNASFASVSYAKGIKIINNYDIEHKCNTLSGSSGGPILNLTTNKVIGIHKGAINKNNNVKFNIGTLLKFPLNEINNNKNKSNIKNEKNMEVKINNQKPGDDGHKPDDSSKINSIEKYFPYPPLIGLDNIGATCYMNPTLQCLCNIKKFVNYFKYNPHLIKIVKNDISNSKLCTSFKTLIDKLWPDNYNKAETEEKGLFSLNVFSWNSNEEEINEKKGMYKSYPPWEFKEKISTMNPLFKGVAANDVKDLVQFLIMTLHQELNKAKENNMNNAVNQDQTNKQLMFQIFAKDFINSNVSIISDLFYGVNYNITQCGFCNTQSFNYQTYFFLIFPLEEVRKFKEQNNSINNYNNYFNNNEVNIYDCFFYDQKINYMTGENIMYCNYCKNTCNNSVRTILSIGPEILIIILNRGRGIQFRVKINFLEEIDLENFIEMKETGCKYNLIGVIEEFGMGEHFIAYCKNPISNEWHRYNDSFVNKVEDFKRDVIDYEMPFVLFYQKSG